MKHYMNIDTSFGFVGMFFILSDGNDHDARSGPSVITQFCNEMEENEIHRSTVRYFSLVEGKICMNMSLQGVRFSN
jgi:hypothetical protein